MDNRLPQELIKKAVAGNTNAFETIVREYQSFAYALSFRFLRQQEEAEDVVQEAFIRLWKNMYKYKPEIKLSTWLYRIITNLCLDYLKSNYARQKINQQDMKLLSEMKSYDQADKALRAEELNTLIQEIASELTPKQKAVFILRDLEGLSVEEVCSILSLSAGSIKSNLYYARKFVSEKLKMVYQTTDKVITI